MTLELERLLWMESEGELDVDDRRRLEELLASTEDPGALRRQIAGIQRVLADLPEVCPPDEMRESIETAVAAAARERARQEAASAPRFELRRRVRAFFASSPRMRFAYAAAGAILGASVVLLLSRSGGSIEPPKDSYYVGALARQLEAPPVLSVADGRLILYRERGHLVAEVEAEDSSAIQFTLTQQGSGLRVIEGGESAQAVVDLGSEGESRVQIDVVGPEGFTLRFEADPKVPIGVRLSSETGALVERSLWIQEIVTR